MSIDIARDLLRDAFDRVHGLVPEAIADLTVEELHHRADSDANPIAWLVWHLTRVQDDHLAGLGDRDQVWASGWADRFDLPYTLDALGYGQTSEDVAAMKVPDPSLLTGYHSAVHDMTLEVLDSFSEEDLRKVIDAQWDPPVTVAIRLVSVVSDTLQHVGQAAYLRGLLLRAR